MSVFLVESEIPQITEEFLNLLPRHRQVVNRLFAEGKLLMYAVNEERSRWWCSVKAEDEFQVMDILSEMPLIRFLDPQISPLMFYNGTEQLLPGISLN
jgi:muconolactone delta-isomerase